MKYVVYANWVNKHARIHVPICGHLGKNGGNTIPGKYEYKYFNSFEDAEKYVNSIAGIPTDKKGICNCVAKING